MSSDYDMAMHTVRLEFIAFAPCLDLATAFCDWMLRQRGADFWSNILPYVPGFCVEVIAILWSSAHLGFHFNPLDTAFQIANASHSVENHVRVSSLIVEIAFVGFLMSKTAGLLLNAQAADLFQVLAVAFVLGPCISCLLMRRWLCFLFCMFSLAACAGLLVTGTVLQPTFHNWVESLPTFGAALLLTSAVRLRFNHCKRIHPSTLANASGSPSNHGTLAQPEGQVCDGNIVITISDSAMGSSVRDVSVPPGAGDDAQTTTSWEHQESSNDNDITVPGVLMPVSASSFASGTAAQTLGAEVLRHDPMSALAGGIGLIRMREEDEHSWRSQQTYHSGLSAEEFMTGSESQLALDVRRRDGESSHVFQHRLMQTTLSPFRAQMIDVLRGLYAWLRRTHGPQDEITPSVVALRQCRSPSWPWQYDRQPVWRLPMFHVSDEELEEAELIQDIDNFNLVMRCGIIKQANSSISSWHTAPEATLSGRPWYDLPAEARAVIASLLGLDPRKGPSDRQHANFTGW
eukprot:gnl/MRDRNA2_/MRDRNA2_86553_c0_seq7.p1 gnl/MRDRNA2_/MRDRNA2_86553_c0~~gnl/MRDRNA2_/MRDRNA2_86553_c0_seq7.p1  ORF type:complete len:537 (-),score=65.26 gnl/MRDRNA2_/MRDRNA2_86553_c0_seq7:278-1828(-)